MPWQEPIQITRTKKRKKRSDGDKEIHAMYEPVRVSTWRQTFPPMGVPDVVFEAIADRPAWSYDYVQSLSAANDDGSAQKLVVITFDACESAASEEMLLVQPIARREARRILVQECGSTV